VRADHSELAVEVFNDDDVYKLKLNQVFFNADELFTSLRGLLP
jgi:hypothetical protein